MDDNTLEARTGLPDALRVLAREYPRDLWASHRNFDDHTRFWMQRHLMFREVLAEATRLTRDYLDGRLDRRVFGGKSAQVIGFMLNELHSHHQIEDMHYFPRLMTVDPRLSAGFELLDADHHALDRHIHAMADTTNAALRALQDGGAARSESGALLEALEQFHRFLDRHLTDEEELVIPTILHHAFRM
jgi:iron-sulfur cluster repair protein YtfE (RIC family)